MTWFHVFSAAIMKCNRTNSSTQSTECQVFSLYSLPLASSCSHSGLLTSDTHTGMSLLQNRRIRLFRQYWQYTLYCINTSFSFLSWQGQLALMLLLSPLAHNKQSEVSFTFVIWYSVDICSFYSNCTNEFDKLQTFSIFREEMFT